jgi:hypothetical protein
MQVAGIILSLDRIWDRARTEIRAPTVHEKALVVSLTFTAFRRRALTAIPARRWAIALTLTLS